MKRRPPRSTRTDTLFPYTTLFRSRAVLALLGFDAEEPTVTGGNPMPLANLFQRLLDLPDRAVMAVIAIVMGETLFAGSAAVEAVGLHIGIDMAAWWSADAAFLASQIGRSSCRERVCLYVYNSVVVVSVKKTKTRNKSE